MNATEKQAKLARLHNRASLYELVMTDGQSTYLVAYCHGKARSTLHKALSSRAAFVVAIAGVESIDFAKRAADGGTMGSWAIRFSGRTQRDAIIEGEHPYVGTVAKA